MKKSILIPAAVGAAAALVSVDVFAAGGTALATGAFDNLYATLEDWTTGSLGRSIALVFLLIGLALGIFRGSIIGAVSSIGAAIALILSPQIIEAIMSTAA